MTLTDTERQMIRRVAGYHSDYLVSNLLDDGREPDPKQIGWYSVGCAVGALHIHRRGEAIPAEDLEAAREIAVKEARLMVKALDDRHIKPA